MDQQFPTVANSAEFLWKFINSNDLFVVLVFLLCTLFGHRLIQKWFQFSNSKLADHAKSGDISKLPEPPIPISLPLIGHIYLLAKYPTNPWQGFEAIRRTHGDVVRLQLGQFRSILVSSIEAIREVLLVKGEIFSDRPHFDRHALIFSKNRQNSLALCDWSGNHKMRRTISHAVVIPRYGSKTFERLSGCIESSLDQLVVDINHDLSLNGGISTLLKKDRVIKLCGAIFYEFLMEQKVDLKDEKFLKMLYAYDFIFWDINQMYLSDFLPFLKPIAAQKYLDQLDYHCRYTMSFLTGPIMERLDKVIADRKENQKEADNKKKENILEGDNLTDKKINEEEIFVDGILLRKQYESSAKFMDFVLSNYLDNQPSLTLDECLYQIADLVGGNSAVANLLMRLLGHVAMNQQVQDQLHDEVVSVLNSRTHQNGHLRITLDDQPHMPLANAAVMETLRLASSPIIPHLNREDTTIQGYFVPKDTMILFNLYHQNLCPDYWGDDWAKFNPSRFVTPEGNVIKPDHFFPFSHGRRSCLGYRMVQRITFSSLTNLLIHYRIAPGSKSNVAKMVDQLQPRGTIALPIDESCYDFTLVPRQK